MRNRPVDEPASYQIPDQNYEQKDEKILKEENCGHLPERKLSQ